MVLSSLSRDFQCCQCLGCLGSLGFWPMSSGPIWMGLGLFALRCPSSCLGAWKAMARKHFLTILFLSQALRILGKVEFSLDLGQPQGHRYRCLTPGYGSQVSDYLSTNFYSGPLLCLISLFTKCRSKPDWEGYQFSQKQVDLDWISLLGSIWWIFSTLSEHLSCQGCARLDFPAFCFIASSTQFGDRCHLFLCKLIVFFEEENP